MVVLVFILFAEFRDELDLAGGVARAALYRGDYFQSLPLRVPGPILDALAVEFLALGRGYRVQDEIDFVMDEGGIPRAHQFGRGLRVPRPFQDRLAALGKGFFGVAGTDLGFHYSLAQWGPPGPIRDPAHNINNRRALPVKIGRRRARTPRRWPIPPRTGLLRPHNPRLRLALR
jgi:hypothetical protein